MIDINILSCVGIDVTKIQSIELEDETINEFFEKMKESLPPSASIGQEQQMLPTTCGKGASW